MSTLANRITQLSPTKLALLSQRLKENNGVEADVQSIPRRDAGAPAALSYAQQRLWFLDQLETGSVLYNIPAATRLRGALDISVLAATLSEIVRRHEVLRTTFDTIDGRALQVVAPAQAIDLPFVDLSAVPEPEKEARRLAFADSVQPFDLTCGPLLRATVIKLDEEDHVILLTMHHIVSDGWSVGVLTREVAALYGAFSNGQASPLAELPIQYSDYAAWEREWLTAEVLEAQLSYWKQQLGGRLPVLELPADRPRPAALTHNGAVHGYALSPELSEQIKAMSRKEGVTLFMLLLAAFKTLLFRYTGQDDVIVGTPIAGRSRVETEKLIGFFVNTLVLRTDLSGNPSFRALLQHVREVVLEAHQHQHIPFEKLVDELHIERTLSHTPLFQIAFNLQNAEPVGLQLPGLRLSGLGGGTSTAKFDLTLDAIESAQNITLSLEYRTDLFDEATIRRLLSHFQNLLQAIVSQADRPLSDLPLLSDEESRHLLCDFNPQPAVLPPAACLHHLFEARAAGSANSLALSCEGRHLSYGEVNARANRLARHLRSLGVRSEDRVAVLLDRTPDLVIAILGILKAGAAYLPLDPAYPAERLSYMLADAGARVIVTEQSQVEAWLLEQSQAALFCLEDEVLNAFGGDNLSPEEVSVTPQHAAYVIYTSGSTGQPKGVVVTHENVWRLLEVTRADFEFDERDVWTLFHSVCFDFSVWELWGALTHGARLVVVPYWVSREPEAFYELLRAEGVTVLNQTPSAFRQLLKVDEAAGASELALRVVIFGGEALEMNTLRGWLERHGEQRPRLVNMYGITETTVHVTYRELRACDTEGGSVIGGALGDMEVYVLDEQMRAVPEGVGGELYVGGGGVARGYLGRAELTAERFVPNPFSEEVGARLYRTGDLARRRADGELEYLGRMDEQVKIRGFRIELGEIEAVLGEQDGVQEAVVVTQAGPTDQRLVAYLLPDMERGAVLRRLLRLEAQKLWPEESRYRLPNGMSLVHLNRADTDFLYKELFAEQSYFKHGIRLKAGACVFDVGANIGLFSLFVSEVCAQAKLYCFEPLPPAFRVLEANAAIYAPEAKLYECGLSNRSGPQPFTYYPEATLMSGQYAAATEEREVVKRYILNGEQGQLSVGEALEESMLEELLDDRLRTEKYECRLRRLSEVMAEEQIEEIDLLKIDVEKSELEVLEGIDEEDWEKIKQIVVEVHDVGGRLEAVRSMLQRHGYQLRLEQDGKLKGTPLHNVYASREWTREVERAEEQGEWRRWYSEAEMIAEVQQHLKEKLPSYMMPSAFVLVSEWPLTANGKLDKRALPEVKEGRRGDEKSFVAPRTPVEELMAGIWRQVLNVERIGVHDNFFALGGDSILSIQITARSNQANLHFTTKQLFLHQTIAELAAVAVDQGVRQPTEAEQSRKAGEIESPGRANLKLDGEAYTPSDFPLANLNQRKLDRIVSKEMRVEDIYPLSPMQQGMLFHSALSPEVGAYVTQTVCMLPGSFDSTAFRQACQKVIERHTILRTSFAWEGLTEPLQIVHERIELAWDEHDWRGLPASEQQARLQAFLSEDQQRGFELTKAPLMRFALFHTGDDSCRLIWTSHHLLLDGWSGPLVLKEVFDFYGAYSRAENLEVKQPRPFRDYIAWLQTQDVAKAETFWRETLHGFEAPTRFITDEMSSGSNGKEAAYLETRIAVPSASASALQTLARQHQLTLNTIIQGMWALLISHYSGENDVVFGSTVSGRPADLPGVETMVGLFINTLPVRVKLKDDESLVTWLQRLQRDQAEMRQFDSSPLVQLQGWSDVPRGQPLFESNLVFFNLPEEAATRDPKDAAPPTPKSQALTVRDLNVQSKTPTDIPVTLKAMPAVGSLQLEMLYDNRRVDAAGVERILKSCQALIERILAQPQSDLQSLKHMLQEMEISQRLTEKTKRKEFDLNRLKSLKPKAVSLSRDQLIKTDFLEPGATLPLVVQPNDGDIDLVGWARNNRQFIETNLLRNGGILFRGFDVDSINSFDQFTKAIAPEQLEYMDQHTPRTRLAGKIYTSTEYPAEHVVPFHSENSKNHVWPMKIWFYCVQPAAQGGETPIADNAKVFELLSPGIRERFVEKKVMYVRNFGEGVGLPWQTVFQTTERSEVEAYCREAGMEFEWKDENRLRTRHVCQSVAQHPQTKKMLWFNQAHLFHISSLEASARESLLSIFKEHELPSNAYYGDGSSIEDSIIEEIREAFKQASVAFLWQARDILMLDNMAIAHGRKPYSGTRKVVVAMADSFSNSQL